MTIKRSFKLAAFSLAFILNANLSFASPSVKQTLDFQVSPLQPIHICQINEDYIKTLANDLNIEKYDQELAKRDKRSVGHTYKKHVAKTGEELLQLIEKDKKLRVASSYYDQLTAEYVIKKGIQLDSKRIIGWMNSPDTDKVLKLKYKTDKPVGFSVVRGDAKVVDSSAAYIILKKDHDCNFIILTSYPLSGE